MISVSSTYTVCFLCKSVEKVVPGRLLDVQELGAKDQEVADELYTVADDAD